MSRVDLDELGAFADQLRRNMNLPKIASRVESAVEELRLARKCIEAAEEAYGYTIDDVDGDGLWVEWKHVTAFGDALAAYAKHTEGGK